MRRLVPCPAAAYSAPMARSIIMLAFSFVVVGVTTALLFWFMRRLRLIEEARWGKEKKKN